LEASQRFCLEPALLVGEGRGAEEGARRGEKEGLAGAAKKCNFEQLLKTHKELPWDQYVVVSYGPF